MKNCKFSYFDEKVFQFKMDRNNMLMSSYFACTQVVDPNFLMRSSEFYENAEINRFHRFFDQVKI